MKNRKSFLREFRSGQSVFLKIYGVLFLAVMASLVMIMVWTNNDAQERNRVRLAEESLSRIEAMDIGVNQALESVAKMMTQLVWNRDLCDFMIAGGKEDGSRDYRIATMLNNCLRGKNNFLTCVTFGSERGDRFFRSGTYEIQAANQSLNYQVVHNALASNTAIFFSEDQEQGVTTYLVNTGAQLLLVQIVKIGMEPIGICISEIDPVRFAEAISDTGELTDLVYIYDSAQKPVLLRVMDYTRLSFYREENPDLITRESIRDNSAIPMNGCYYVESSMTGFCYYLRTDLTHADLQPLTILRGSFLPLLCMLIIVLGVNLYVVRALYLPIARLVEKVSEDTGTSDDRRRKNEFDVLEGAYSDARNRQERLRSTIDNFAPDLMETTLRKLLGGKMYTREALDEILQEINGDIKVDGRYEVCICHIEEPGNRQVSEREWALYAQSLQNLISEMPHKNLQRYSVPIDRQNVAVILRFPDTTSVVQIKRESRELCQYLIKNTEPFPYTLQAEYGQIYNSLTDIHESYLESMEKLRYQTNRMQRGETERIEPAAILPNRQETMNLSAEKPAAPPTEREDRPGLRQHVTESIQLSLKGTQDSALALHHHVMDEMENRFREPEDRRIWIRMYLDEWTEQLAAYAIGSEDLEELLAAETTADIMAENDEEKLLERMDSRVRAACRILTGYGKTNRYRYIDQARNYIEANYDNKDLSLNVVAEDIGISSSYLSELFVEVTGSKFSAALAEIRVEHAKHQLSNTATSIKEIGDSCGFNSVQNFIRVFKKVSGFTPGQYRDMKNRSAE